MKSFPDYRYTLRENLILTSENISYINAKANATNKHLYN